jgi:hypothetical protein
MTFITTSQPTRGIDGRFSPWIIKWQNAGGSSGPGILIQRITYRISATYSGGDDLSQEDIWNKWPYQGEPRFDYWEAWTDDVTSTGNWNDAWSGPGEIFYSSLTSGVLEMTGIAGWYPISSLDSIGDGWGHGGENQSSPMSGDLLSTAADALALPQPVGGIIQRTLTVSWDPCSNSGSIENTTVAFGSSNGPQIA